MMMVLPLTPGAPHLGALLRAALLRAPLLRVHPTWVLCCVLLLTPGAPPPAAGSRASGPSSNAQPKVCSATLLQ